MLADLAPESLAFSFGNFQRLVESYGLTDTWSWALTELAAASGLSFSTVRRLEDGTARADRARHAAIAALRAGGIRFSLMDGATVASARCP
jgi:hypothetical protein